MDYISWEISCGNTTESKELLYPILSEFGFDSFEESDKGLKAFIPKQDYKDDMVDSLIHHPWLAALPTVSVNVAEIPHQNWNEVWESNFQPIEVEDALCIRAPFHPKSNKKEEIIIEPQMSFGTGHHETTFLMCKQLLAMDLKEQTLLDMGSGTGILALLAEKLGAKSTLGIEIDAMAVENSIHNGKLNNSNASTFLVGDADSIPNEKFDVVLANINRNILLKDIPKYAAAMKPNASLFLSGFYTTDNEQLIEKAREVQLNFIENTAKNDWSLLQFKK